MVYSLAPYGILSTKIHLSMIVEHNPTVLGEEDLCIQKIKRSLSWLEVTKHGTASRIQ